MQNDVKRRSLLSTLSLFFQSGYSAALGLVANLIVTILLTPQVFGIYVTVLSIISILNYFSDIGLAASLIQKKHLDDEDVATTFTIQLIMSIVIVVVGAMATGIVTRFYHLPADGTYLYWSLLAGFFISGLKTIPSIFLERQIKFQKLVLVQVVENTVFYAVVSILALMGYGLMSFTIAVLFRAVIGMIMIYYVSPYRPRLIISRPHLRQLLDFGVPFQASSFLALFKDDLLILYLSHVLGFTGIGYIGWAKKWADAPIRIIMDNISRVLFPLISRLQDDTRRIREVIEQVIEYQTLLIAPVITGMMLTVGIFTQLIPHYDKWRPALPLFYLFSISSLILSMSAPFMNLYNALGKVRITFTFMTILTAAAWLTTPLLSQLYGYYGFPVAHLIMSCLLGLILIYARRTIKANILPVVYKPLLSSLIMAIVMNVLTRFHAVGNYVVLGVYILITAGAYYVTLRYVFNVDLVVTIRTLYAKK